MRDAGGDAPRRIVKALLAAVRERCFRAWICLPVLTVLTACDRTPAAKPPQTTLAPTVAATAPAPDARSLPIKPEVPEGYPADPSPIHTPMRQDVTALELRASGNGRYDVRLGDGERVPALRGVDMRPFIPRVPALARGNATLTRIALMQRELNRNETAYGPAAGADDAKVANNCLRQGLWEVILSRRGHAGLAAE